MVVCDLFDLCASFTLLSSSLLLLLLLLSCFASCDFDIGAGNEAAKDDAACDLMCGSKPGLSACALIK